MVGRLILLFLAIPLILIGADFTANVNKNELSTGETLVLTLTLQDISAEGLPSIEILKRSFNIVSQQQSSSTRFTNSHKSSSLLWKYTLLPLKEGNLTIPSIHITTSKGVLSTQPIDIHVSAGSKPSHSKEEEKDVLLSTTLSNPSPYKNEPLFFNVKISSASDLTDVRIHKIDIEGAAAELNQQPKITKSTVKGVRQNVIEFTYLITPLKEGTLMIPSVVVQGNVARKGKPHAGSFFDDDFDPFSMMSLFGKFQPFTTATEKVELKVKSPQEGINPWLPAKNIVIEETFDESQPFQVGEPFVRGIKISVQGLSSNQIPPLNSSLTSLKQFRVYEDKPELGEEFKNETLHSFRKEQYTLIPEEAGQITLPEMNLLYWDTVKNEKAVASLPARTLTIAPHAPIYNPVALEEPINQRSISLPLPEKERDPLLYAILGGLAVLLFGAVLWVISLQRKINRLTEAPAPTTLKTKTPSNLKPSSLPVQKEEVLTEKKKKDKLPDLNPT